MYKRIICGIIICLSLASTFNSVWASEIKTVNTGSNAEIQRGDVYEYKYKYINNIKCKRLWNVTKGEWAEPYWTPCE